MIDEQLLSETRKMTDTRILNTLNQSYNFSENQVQAAKLIAKERNLNTPSDNQININTSDLIKEAKTMIENKVPISEIERRFKVKEIPEDQIVSAIHTASLTAEMGKKPEHKKHKEGNFSYWWVLFVIYLVIKYGLRAMSN